MLLTAKPVVNLVNLSEKDFVRKKNKWYLPLNLPIQNVTSFFLPRLPKIQVTNNPGDPLLPFSVALEERLAAMTPEDKEEGEKEGAPSALGKIAQAGYSSLDVSVSFTNLWIQFASRRLIVNPILHMRDVRGPFGEVQKHPCQMDDHHQSRLVKDWRCRQPPKFLPVPGEINGSIGIPQTPHHDRTDPSCNFLTLVHRLLYRVLRCPQLPPSERVKTASQSRRLLLAPIDKPFMSVFVSDPCVCCQPSPQSARPPMEKFPRTR